MPQSIDRRRALALLGSFVAAPRLGRAAEAWPIRSVKYVNGFPAGGATDTLSRLICQKMSELSGQSFVVENKAGAGGAFAIASAPSTPPAPALFSTTKDCPDNSLSFWQSTRESVSVAPPAGKPLTYFTDRTGQASAARPTRGASHGAVTRELTSASARRRSIDSGIDVLPSRAMRRVAASLLLLSLLPVCDLSTRGEARSVDLSLGAASEAAKSAYRDKRPGRTSRAFCRMENARTPAPAQAPVVRLRSANGVADGFAAALCGRDLVSRRQDAELNGRDGWGCGRSFLNVFSAEHLNLNSRDRQAGLFVSRQLGCDGAGDSGYCEHGGSDGQRNLLHDNSPRMKYGPNSRLLRRNSSPLRRTNM